MFKWIKMWLGIDEPKKPEPKQELPKELAPILNAMSPKTVDKPVEEKKSESILDPLGMGVNLVGKPKKVAKKPATKKAAPRKPNKLDKGK